MPWRQFPRVKFARLWGRLAVSRYANISALYSVFGQRFNNLTSARPVRTNRPRAQVVELVDALASGASGLTAVKVRVLSWAPLSMPKPRSPTSFRCSDPHQQLHSLLGASKRFEVAVGSRQQQRAFKLAQHHGRGEIRIARRHAEAEQPALDLKLPFLEGVAG